jgi:ureidoacrylate peracid hydrolase
MKNIQLQASLDPAASALLIIDMQNDFLHREGYFARRGLAVEVLQPTIAATRDLRDKLPSLVRVVYTVQLYEPDGSDDIVRIHHIKPAGLVRLGREIPVARGGWGAEIVTELQPRSQDVVLAKRRFDAFHQTNLELLLRSWGIKTLLFAGVIADVCVETSMRSAFVRDFDVVLARDCVASWKKEYLDRTADVVDRAFGICMSNAEITTLSSGQFAI